MFQQIIDAHRTREIFRHWDTIPKSGSAVVHLAVAHVAKVCDGAGFKTLLWDHGCAHPHRDAHAHLFLYYKCCSAVCAYGRLFFSVTVRLEWCTPAYAHKYHNSRFPLPSHGTKWRHTGPQSIVLWRVGIPWYLVYPVWWIQPKCSFFCQIRALQLIFLKVARLYNIVVWGYSLTCRHMQGSAGERSQTLAMGQWLAFSMHQNTGLRHYHWECTLSFSPPLSPSHFPSFLFPLLLSFPLETLLTLSFSFPSHFPFSFPLINFWFLGFLLQLLLRWCPSPRSWQSAWFPSPAQRMTLARLLKRKAWSAAGWRVASRVIKDLYIVIFLLCT